MRLFHLEAIQLVHISRKLFAGSHGCVCVCVRACVCACKRVLMAVTLECVRNARSETSTTKRRFCRSQNSIALRPTLRRSIDTTCQLTTRSPYVLCLARFKRVTNGVSLRCAVVVLPKLKCRSSVACCTEMLTTERFAGMDESFEAMSE